jgi:hypothetical protein
MAKTSRLFRFRPKPQRPALRVLSPLKQQASSSGDACCLFDWFHGRPPSKNAPLRIQLLNSLKGSRATFLRN